MGSPASAHLDLHASISTVATAQILSAAGYAAAEPSALRALADIAHRYISSLGLAAAAHADARGRTEANLLDLILALEGHSPAGFPGASDPARPALRSGVLSELAGFVEAVREVPFAKPVPREGAVGGRWESFAAAGREPPLRHVPRWLPCFPEGWGERRRCEAEEEAGDGVVVVSCNDERKGAMVPVPVSVPVPVPEKREKVRFRVGVDGKKQKSRRVGLAGKCGGFELIVGD